MKPNGSILLGFVPQPNLRRDNARVERVMNKNKLKSYAPAARREFIQAVTDKAHSVGLISDSRIEPLEVSGDVVIIGGREFPARIADQRNGLEHLIRRDGFEQVMEAVAYTWFNRFAALRYMELHAYLGHGFRVLSNRNNTPIPEILENAANVNFSGLNSDKVVEMKLDGSRDEELYRLLLVAQCNALHTAMPFLFERIGGATELLLPDNLLHSDSLLRKLVTEINEEDWQEIEIIGWLYQFYISEKKDQVIGKIVKSEDIPAATQLFTPKWIVKYMVQNTLGRQWLATYPNSPLREKMEYYIEPAEQTDEIKTQLAATTPTALDPETITFMDTAAGSGHILVESYDLFKEIYLERGYRTRDIPRLILEQNLYGLEIDDRAAQLAGFALLMKARSDDRGILDADNPVQLNVLAIQETKDLNVNEIAKVLLRERVIELESNQPRQQELFPHRQTQPILSKVEKPEVTQEDLTSLIDLFEDGKTFGSLLVVPEPLKEALPKFERLLAKAEHWDMQSRKVAAMILPLVKQAGLLAKEYHCVVTNPPYMGGRGLNTKLKAFASDDYPNSKSDLFAMFIERNLGFAAKQNLVGMITMQSWMFLSSFEKLRENILDEHTMLSMAHLGARAFDTIGGEVVQTTTFVIRNAKYLDYKGTYLRLVDGSCETDKEAELKGKKSEPFLASFADFKKIPGSPIAYWVSKKMLSTFDFPKIRSFTEGEGKNVTSDNSRFVRYSWEVTSEKLGRQKKWLPYAKGGSFRKWAGNIEHVVNWSESAREYYKQFSVARIIPEELWYRDGITWTDITSGGTGFRYLPTDTTFDATGLTIFLKSKRETYDLIGLLNSPYSLSVLRLLNPTFHAQLIDVKAIPVVTPLPDVGKTTKQCITITQSDWTSYETSWDFTTLPLLQSDHHQPSLQQTYTKLRTHWREMTQEMQRLEEENNRIFIEAYGLQDEITPEVPLAEITLTCNPHYRYGGNKTEEELESSLLTDTMKELISYAIGCMMGRYSLDHAGLIYAHSGNVGFDPSKYDKFPADEDGIVPITDMEWFPDDVATRFIEFLQAAWPVETLEQNLKFIAECLSPKSGELPVDTIRRYLSSNFYKDHLSTYKKRPIYWLFSSGKEKAFQCLVYLHRYNEGTLSRMRNEYVTPLFGKMNARVEFLSQEKEAASSTSARNRFQKQIDVLKKKISELSTYDDELRHYADKRITLDLDDGVKANYAKFGKLLAEVKAITGSQK